MLVNVGDDDQFVGAGFRDQRLDSGANRLGEPTMEWASILFACAFSIGDQ